MLRSRGSASRDPSQQRREEINGCLEVHGFGRDAVARRSPADADPVNEMERLCQLLPALGPVFASFGRYLGSRPDLLPLADCVALSRIVDRADPTAPADIRRVIDEGIESQAVEEMSTDQPRFARFEAEPFESRLLFQLHHGELENGDLVVVKVIHPTFHLDEDVRLMPLIAPAVAPRLTDANQFVEAVASFHRVTSESVDCLHTADVLTALEHDTRDNDALCTPHVYLERCSQNVLVTQRLDGVRLDHYIAQGRGDADPLVAHTHPKQSIVPDELARLLCDTWLYQAFQGTMLPVDVCPQNILIRSPTEIAILDGAFQNLPAATRRNLLNYLVAVATDEPSKSLTCLLKELDGTHRNTSPTALDRQFRQLVAFRDGGWEDGGRANCLSDTLFAQWRLAASKGFLPLRHLTHFYRGTFHIANIARRVAPDRDSLLEGVKDLRLTKLLNDIGTMMEPSYWGGQADRLASLMILGPQHLDDALKSMSIKEDPTGKPPEASRRPKSHIYPIWLTLLTLLVAFLLRDELAGWLAPNWAERLTAVLFIVLGGVALRLLAFPGKS